MKLKVFIILFIGFIFAENSSPIILLHGFLGWGRDEMKDYYYWGGKFDLETWLIEEGYEVYTVSVGPVSSNWDRAVEAYYQIKGGQVDYGKSHSEEFGLIQKPAGKSYDGFLPQWDENNPIHIISHSQGGQTARMLEYLLKLSLEDDSNLLSQNKQDWIKSITTISTPHNGTTLSNIVMDNFPITIKLGVWFGAIYEDGFLESFYNLDLDQWGLKRNENEKMMDFIRRVNKSPAVNSNNLSQYDLSINGSFEFNEIYTIDPNVHYFTYSTYSTKVVGKKGKHFPDWSMSAELWLGGTLLGTLSAPDSSWYENDGIVNTISMKGPKRRSGIDDPICEYNEISKSGCWQNMGKLHIDHHKVVGHGLKSDDTGLLKDLYGNHCQILKELN